MNHYREFQFGWTLVVVFAIVQFAFTLLFMLEVGSRPVPLSSFLVMSGMMVSIILLMYSMTTLVDKDRITISFGIGLIRRKIDLNRVKSIEKVTSPWYYGWGIRLIPDGWLYNVSGSGAVEIHFADAKRIVRIGSKDPKRLWEEINLRLRPDGEGSNIRIETK